MSAGSGAPPDAGSLERGRPIDSSWAPPFQRHLGIEMRVGEAGEGIAEIDVDPERHMGRLWVHGGLLAALVDVAAGVAISTEIGPDAAHVIDGTIELKINYLRKARGGRITATGRVVHRGRRVAVAEVDIANDATLCAKAIATYMLTAPDGGS